MRTPEEILEQEFGFGIPLNGLATETIVPAMIKYAEQFSNQVEPLVSPMLAEWISVDKKLPKRGQQAIWYHPEIKDDKKRKWWQFFK